MFAAISAWISANLGILIPSTLGALIHVFVSGTLSLVPALIRLSAGIFVGVITTEPMISVLMLDPESWTQPVAGGMSIMGFHLAKTLSDLTPEKLIDLIIRLRSGGKD